MTFAMNKMDRHGLVHNMTQAPGEEDEINAVLAIEGHV